MPARAFIQLLDCALKIGLIVTRIVALREALDALVEVTVLLGSTLDLVLYEVLHYVLLQLLDRLIFLVQHLSNLLLLLLMFLDKVLELGLFFQEALNS